MISSSVANRYALALFQLSKEHDILDRIEGELRVVRDIINENTGFKAILKSPKLTKEKKKEIINQSFGSAHLFVLNTLMLLVDRHREEHIIDMIDQYIELVNDEKGIAEAQVYTVRPLTEQEQEALSSTFAAKVGKQSLRINNIVDSNLLGGVKLRIGNRILDGTLRGKLERLERQLLG